MASQDIIKWKCTWMTERKQHLQHPGEILCMKNAFWLINEGETFQREMDIEFVEEKHIALSSTWMI
jgi:hypothetical protein